MTKPPSEAHRQIGSVPARGPRGPGAKLPEVEPVEAETIEIQWDPFPGSEPVAPTMREDEAYRVSEALRWLGEQQGSS